MAEDTRNRSDEQDHNRRGSEESSAIPVGAGPSSAHVRTSTLHAGPQAPEPAIENPYVTAISHPTGRLINKRRSYDIDLEAVFEAAAKHGKFMELNANPRRLDLDDVNCAAAKRHGIPVVISTDAHSINNLDLMRYGILQARRAGLTKDDVVNTRPWEEVRRMMRQ